MAASVVAAGGEVGGMAARVPRQGPIAISCLISFLPRALRESPSWGVFAKQTRQATGAAGGFICIFATAVGWKMDGQSFVHLCTAWPLCTGYGPNLESQIACESDS